MRDSLSFLARFAVAAGLLYGLWRAVAPLYLAVVVPPVNLLFRSLHLPVLLLQRNHVLLLAYHHAGAWIRLQAHGYDVVYLNLIAAMALIAATPSRSLRWRLAWSGVLAALLWITHLLCFFAEGQIAIWRYVDSLPAGPVRANLAAQVQVFFPAARGHWCAVLVDRWNIWGRYGLVVGVWFFALRSEIGSRSAGWWRGETARWLSAAPRLQVHRHASRDPEARQRRVAQRAEARRSARRRFRRAG